jgi:hypothetical protein
LSSLRPLKRKSRRASRRLQSFDLLWPCPVTPLPCNTIFDRGRTGVPTQKSGSPARGTAVPAQYTRGSSAQTVSGHSRSDAPISHGHCAFLLDGKLQLQALSLVSRVGRLQRPVEVVKAARRPNPALASRPHSGSLGRNCRNLKLSLPGRARGFPLVISFPPGLTRAASSARPRQGAPARMAEGAKLMRAEREKGEVPTFYRHGTCK